MPSLVRDLLSGNLPDRADRVALVDGERTLTYGELAAEVDRVAAWLQDRGVQAGDRVAVHLRKTAEEVIATFAAARIGAVFVNVFTGWTLEQLDYILRHAGAEVLITDAARARKLVDADLPATLQAVLVQGDAPDHPLMSSWGALESSAAPQPVVLAEDDLAAILYTSGSTGQPKGVMLSNRNLVLGADSVAGYLGNTADDRICSYLPLCFDYGLNQITTAFLVGASVVLHGVPMESELVRTLVDQRVTGLAIVAPAWTRLVDYLTAVPTELPDLRYVTNSGGAIPTRILEAMPKVFPGVEIFLMYGLTEAFRSTYLPPHLFESKRGSMGKAVPHAAVYVVGKDGELCEPGQTGELVHSGPLVSLGYWNDPEATAAKIRPCPALRDILGDEKVCYSGDTVRLDEDGFLWFVGREDSLIKVRGIRVSPTEVEDVFYRQDPVVDAVAFGVPDEQTGEAIHVAVAIRDDEPFDAGALLRACRRHLPAYMVPARVHHWPGPMPRGATKKIDRPRVVRACCDALQGPASDRTMAVGSDVHAAGADTDG